MFIYSYDIGWLQQWIPPSLRNSSSSFSMCWTIQRSLLKSSFHLDRTLWRLELALFSGALMWSCTERSVAPSPAGSTTASCDVWAGADGTGVQEAPAPRCSPSSSPVLRKEGEIRTIKTKDAIKTLTRPSARLTIQLPFDEVHPVRDLILDCVDVVQQVDLPLLMLPAVVVWNFRLPSLLFLYLSLRPRVANQSLKRNKFKLHWINYWRKKKRISQNTVMTTEKVKHKPC